MRYDPSFFQPAKRIIQTRKCEEQLRRILKANMPQKVVLEAAEQLRSAKLAEIKAREVLADPPAKDAGKRRLANIDSQAEKWRDISVDDIIKRHRPRASRG